MAASLNSATVVTVKVQGNTLPDGTGSWAAIKDKTGADLQFTAANTIDNAALENGVLFGTLDLTRLDTVTVPAKALRLALTTNTGATILLAASYRIEDLYEEPSGTDDDLLFKQLPYTK